VKASLALIVFALPAAALAHVHLIAPPSWTTENSFGDPQDMPPCGGEGGVNTGAVTTVHAGDTIKVQWQETVAHDGHFRIALVQHARSEFADPKFTEVAGGCMDGTQNVCSTSAVIQNPPVYPVLLDGLFVHTAGSVTVPMAYEQAVTIPNLPCSKCTLQLIQFQNHHPPGYFHHHCADLTILPSEDGGTGGSHGKGCALAARGKVSAVALVFVAALVLVLRRRRATAA
jgi:hypothetical protein